MSQDPAPSQQGLIHALRLDGQGAAKELDWEGVRQWQPEAGVLWLHLDYSDAHSQQWLAEESGLDELVAEALIAEDTRPRVTPIGDGLLISLRGANRNPGSEPEDMVALRLWIDGQRIITTRRRVLYSVRDLVEELHLGKGPVDCPDFLIELCDKLTSRVGDVVEQTEERMAELEEAVLDAESYDLRSQLSALRRQTIGLRKFLAPQREALLRLQLEKVSWLEERDRAHLREVGDHLIRNLEDLEAVRDRAVVTQEELVNRLSDQMNKRMYVLSIIAAIFLPLGFFTGLLGINVGGIPGAENPHAFALFIGILCVIVVLQLAAFRKLKWL